MSKSNCWLLFLAILGWMLFFMVLYCWLWFPDLEASENYTNTQIVNSIFHIEGGLRAQYAYGIRSIKYKNIVEARRICYNTVRNNRKRYAQYGYKKFPDFISFLQSRYCPTRGKLSRAEKRLNKFWLSNLRRQLKRIY